MASWLAATAVNGYALRILSWEVARAGGLVAPVMLIGGVTLGILESTPRVGCAANVRAITHQYHPWPMLVALVFVVVHVTSLVLAPYAGVSLATVFVPGLADHRPVGVSLGIGVVLAGLLLDLTAWFPARRPRLPLQPHGVTAGTDTPRLLGGYAVTGALPLAASALRYALTRPLRWARAGTQAGEGASAGVPQRHP